MTYPVIGSKYTGPSLSRPALRQLPIYWHLSDRLPDARRYHWWDDVDAKIGLFAMVIGLIACVVTIKESLP